MTNSLDVNRRSFFGLLIGAAAASVVVPVVERVARSQWGDVLRQLRGAASPNPVTHALVMVDAIAIADAYSQVERWDLTVRQVWMHPVTYARFRRSYATGRMSDLFYEEDGVPRLWGATVHVTDEVGRKEVFVASSLDDPRGIAAIRVL